jgi:lysophospholipase L1-like esterase
MLTWQTPIHAFFSLSQTGRVAMRAMFTLDQVTLIATILMLTTTLAAQERSKLGAQTIVFLGDSITESGAVGNGYVNQLRKSLETRNPDRKLEIVGKGVSGNRVPDLLARLNRDVLSLSPDLVVIYIGINDVWHSQSGAGTSETEFESGLTSIVQQISVTGAKVILCTPSVIGEKTDGTNPLDTMLDEYAAISRKVAVATGSTVIDLRKMFLRDLKILNSGNAEKGILTSDGVHLNDAGNEFVKDCMLHSVESVLFAKSLKHVVLVKFKPEICQAEINHVTEAFNDLKNQIDTIASLESGTDISPEGLSQGYTHAFVLTYANARDRDAYLVHPAHKKFVELALPKVDGVMVVDFWAR